jgi:hypothetical protein
MMLLAVGALCLSSSAAQLLTGAGLAVALSPGRKDASGNTGQKPPDGSRNSNTGGNNSGRNNSARNNNTNAGGNSSARNNNTNAGGNSSARNNNTGGSNNNNSDNNGAAYTPVDASANPTGCRYEPESQGRWSECSEPCGGAGVSLLNVQALPGQPECSQRSVQTRPCNRDLRCLYLTGWGISKCHKDGGQATALTEATATFSAGRAGLLASGAWSSSGRSGRRCRRASATRRPRAAGRFSAPRRRTRRARGGCAGLQTPTTLGPARRGTRASP